jgi:hypothetical protein
MMPGALASLLLLAAWLGAAVLVAAVVAPAAFAVLPARALAGALVGRVLPVIFWSGMVVGVGAMLLARPVAMKGWLGASLITLVAACAAVQFGIVPRIARLREQIGGAIDALDPSDPRRQVFGKLHGLSVAGLGVGMVAAVVAVIVLFRLASTRSTA